MTDKPTKTPPEGPRLSVGLPVYNGEAFLRQSVDSILSQSFTDFELLISDNASTDDTQAICEEYAAQDSRVKYDRCSTNVGAAKNYNRLVAMARGELFKWGAHDDNCRPELFDACVEALDRDPEAVLAYPLTALIDGDGEVISEYRDGLALPSSTPHERLATYLRGNFVRHQGLCNPIFGIMRLSQLRRTRLIQRFLASDLTLLAHLSLLGRFVEVPRVLFERRVHAGISTFANKKLSDRRAWFAGPRTNRSRLDFLQNNYVGLRATHIRDFYRAISELVDDANEQRRCRVELAKVLFSDVRWLYWDVKRSLGFTSSPEEIMRSLRESAGTSKSRS